MWVNLHRLARWSLLPLLALAVAACDNPVEDDEDHPAGLIVMNAQNQQVASFRVGGPVTGQLIVPRGTATTFTVVAVTEAGTQLAIDGTETGLKAALSGGEGSAVVQSPNRVVVTSSQGGTRTLVLTLTHDGHDEFNGSFPVIVAG